MPDTAFQNDNLQTIASQRHLNIQDLIDGESIPKPNLADKFGDVQKHNILCILDTHGTRNGITEIPGYFFFITKNDLVQIS